MSAEVPMPIEASPSEPDVFLPEPVQKHLGKLLAQLYAQPAEASATTQRFADLLAKLDAALGTARAKEDGEFQAMMLAAAPALRRFAISLTHDATVADDLVQEALMRAWGNRARFVKGTNFEAWTFTILRNHYYSGMRKHREVADPDGAYSARLVSLPEQGARLALGDLQVALNRLPAVMREALLLVVVEGLPYEEVAQIMGCELGTVKSRLSRARGQLAIALGYGGDASNSDGLMLSALAGVSRIDE